MQSASTKGRHVREVPTWYCRENTGRGHREGYQSILSWLLGLQ